MVNGASPRVHKIPTAGEKAGLSRMEASGSCDDIDNNRAAITRTSTCQSATASREERKDREGEVVPSGMADESIATYPLRLVGDGVRPR